MKSLRYGVIACLVIALWPGVGFAQGEGSRANANSRPTLQAPYGQDKTQRRAAQGNNGRPVMRDPYGKDQGRSRLETGNQGRPITRGTESKSTQTKEQRKEAVKTVETKTESKKDDNSKKEKAEEKKGEKNEAKEAKDEKKEEKKEEKEEEKADTNLPAPLTTKAGYGVASSGWDLAVTPETLLGKRYIQLVKSLDWTFAPNVRIAGFHVYEQAPGESGFHLYQSIDLQAVGIGSQSYVSRQFTSQAGDTMTLTSYKLATGAVFVVLSEWRLATAWPIGTYRHVIVAYDAKGREGTKSPIVSATNLGEIQVLRPKEGEVLERVPAFQWSNVWPANLESNDTFTYPGYGSTEVIVSEYGKIVLDPGTPLVSHPNGSLWHVWLSRTKTSELYWFGSSWATFVGKRGEGYALLPGHQYYFIVHTWGGNGTDGYIGYSRLMSFTVK